MQYCVGLYLTVQQYLGQLFVKKRCLVVPAPVSHLLPALPVLMGSTVHRTISARLLVLLPYFLSYSSQICVLVYCSSNLDCDSLSSSTVCKETVHGGAKTCREPETGTEDCSSHEFCAADNSCQPGKFLIIFYTDYNCLLGVCGVMSDCSTLPGFTVCKEISGGSSLTCQPVSSCLADCSLGEYCSVDNTCIRQGLYWNTQLIVIHHL